MANLDKIFSNTAKGPSGNCPLPEPSRGAPTIEHVDHMRVARQPPGYNYDQSQNKAEQIRFRKQLAEMVQTGQVTQAEADKLLLTSEL
jgi:hypothetical protein